MDREDLLLSIFVAVEGAHAFSAFNPSVFTIRRFPDGQTAEDIRTGCVYASIFTLIIGGVTALLINNPLPVFFAIAVAAGMSMVYETTVQKALRGEHNAQVQGMGRTSSP